MPVGSPVVEEGIQPHPGAGIQPHPGAGTVLEEGTEAVRRVAGQPSCFTSIVVVM